MQDSDAQLARAVLFHAEALGHAALALDAILEGDAAEIALPVIGPGVVDAAEILCALAVIVETDQRATMGAAVLERIDLAVIVTGDHDRGVANLGGAEVAGLRQFHLKRQVMPGRPLEDPLL